MEEIRLEDRITYAEAAEIRRRSRGYLRKFVIAGRLARTGGQTGAAYRTFLSRTRVEALALWSTAVAAPGITGSP